MFRRFMYSIVFILIVAFSIMSCAAAFNIFDPLSLNPDSIVPKWSIIGLGLGMGIVFLAIWALCAFTLIFDTKVIPSKKISRSIMQDVAIIVIDGVLFIKREIKWATVALRHVKLTTYRNFFGTIILRQLIIDTEKIQIETPVEDIINVEEFSMGDENEQGEEKV